MLFRSRKLLAGGEQRIGGNVGRADHEGSFTQVLFQPRLYYVVWPPIILNYQCVGSGLLFPTGGGFLVWGGWRRKHPKILPHFLLDNNRERHDAACSLNTVPHAVENILERATFIAVPTLATTDESDAPGRYNDLPVGEYQVERRESGDKAPSRLVRNVDPRKPVLLHSVDGRRSEEHTSELQSH